MSNTSVLTLLVVLLLAVSGCASPKSVQNAPLHAGLARTFQSDYDSTLDAAREAIIEAGLQIESASEVDDNTYMIIAKKGTSMVSWGGVVRVTVISVNPEETTVRVVSERRLATNVTAKGDYSNAILSNIELKLRA